MGLNSDERMIMECFELGERKIEQSQTGTTADKGEIRRD
jgi:hypothetical protein